MKRSIGSVGKWALIGFAETRTCIDRYSAGQLCHRIMEGIRWAQIGVFIKVENDHYFPANLLLISLADDDGTAYMR